MTNVLEPPESSNSISLVDGTVAEIGKALRQLGATPATIAQAMASFGFKKIPGAMVSKIQNGYKVGESVLPESQSPITQEVGVVSAVVARIMIATTDDKRFALVA